jgi:hypothetical protein
MTALNLKSEITLCPTISRTKVRKTEAASVSGAARSSVLGQQVRCIEGAALPSGEERRALRCRRGERTQKISLAGRRQKKPSAEGEAAKGFKALNVRSLAKSSDRRQSAIFGQKKPSVLHRGLEADRSLFTH